MFSKLVKALFKETTNTKDISSVTFNSSGTYNPRYGKQKVYVSGKGGDGSYAAGTPYYNVVPGNYYDNSYSYTTNGTNSPSYPVQGNFTYTVTAGTWGDIWNSTTKQVYRYVNWTSYYSFTGAPGFSPSSTYSAAYSYTYYDNAGYTFTGNQAAIYNSGTNYYTVPGTPYSYNTYVPGNTGTNPTNYPYAGTNSPTTNTGTTANVLGISLPGGYGGSASVVPSTRATSIPNYGTPYSVTVPSGGYVTITFTL